jgi:serine/threonine protein kinase
LLPSIDQRMTHLVESHLAGCRDCRALVAALAMDAGTDSNAATSPHEKLSPSQVALRPTRTLTIGDRVGRYLVLTALGAGGMGIVFAAYDPQLDRKVALKLLRAGITYNTKDARTRLRREAQAIAQLSHPNVVAVYDVGTTDEGDLYIAMEFVEGDTLTTWLQKYPRTWREIVDVFLQAGRGVIAAHSVGLLHRDFKPDNVLVGGDGRVRVTDFGLARSLITPDEAARPRPEMAALSVELTATGTVLGTPRYMAPEQHTGPDIDARADQFSFCVALHEALYGEHPLPGATSVSMLEKNDRAKPPPEGTKIPSAITRVVQRGLERDRAKRFPTMSALVSELVPAPKRSSLRYAVVALTGVLLIGAAVAAAVRRPDGPQDLEDEIGNPGTWRPLIAKINELTEQNKRREAENRALLAELQSHEPDTAKIQQLQTEIAERDDKIERLVKEVVILKGKAPPAPRRFTQSELVRGAFDQAHGDLEGCFTEWTDRQGGDADMQIELTVSADGIGHSAKTTSGPDSPILRLCVAESISRVRFPTGPEHLDLVVNVGWDGVVGGVTVSARVVGRHQATKPLDSP